jgi:hypothetical protein
MSEVIKVRPKLVLIRLYMDFVIRHITTILMHIAPNVQNNTITFMTINSATGVGGTKQRNIIISNNVKFDVVELDSDGISSDIISSIFVNGYHETSQYSLQRTDDKKTISVEAVRDAKDAMLSGQNKQGTNKKISKSTSQTVASPVARIVPLNDGTNTQLADVAKRAAAAMQAVRNPTLHVAEEVVENEEFNPDAPPAEVDEG